MFWVLTREIPTFRISKTATLLTWEHRYWNKLSRKVWSRILNYHWKKVLSHTNYKTEFKYRRNVSINLCKLKCWNGEGEKRKFWRVTKQRSSEWLKSVIRSGGQLVAEPRPHQSTSLSSSPGLQFYIFLLKNILLPSHLATSPLLSCVPHSPGTVLMS